MNKFVIVLGIGGAGVKIVGRIATSISSSQLSCAVLDTDKTSLENSSVQNKIQIGFKWTKGLGTGGDINKAQVAFSQSRSIINELVKDTDLIIVTGGFGGGTASAGAQIIGSEARKLEIPVIFMLTVPFSFEGHGKNSIANKAISELLHIADVVIPILNDNLFVSLPPGTPMNEAFEKADIEVGEAIIGISEIIRCENFISTDISNMKNVFENCKTLCSIGIGKVEKNESLNRSHLVLERMSTSPLLGTIKQIKNADVIYISLIGGKDLEIGEMKYILEAVERMTSSNSKIIISTNTDEIYNDTILLTVLCAKFDNDMIKINNSKKQKKQHNNAKEQLDFDDKLIPISKGKFLKSTPFIYNNEDLDEPTFQRKKIIIDKGL